MVTSVQVGSSPNKRHGESESRHSMQHDLGGQLS
jgi:hypothetical protein